MGYNSMIMVCNDIFDAIEKDPSEWWRKTRGRLAVRLMHSEPDEYGFGVSANGCWAVHNAHADNVGLYIVGGNYVTQVGPLIHWGSRGHHRSEDIVDLLRIAAEKYGYDLVPKIGWEPGSTP